jgi:hypothetical protein
MSINVKALAEALPDDQEWSESELEGVIGEIADVPAWDGASLGGARAMLSAGKFVLAKPAANSRDLVYVKNPSPPQPLGFMEQQQAELDRRAAEERALLETSNKTQAQNDERLNGLAKATEAAYFRYQVVHLLIELGVLSPDTPLPAPPEAGRRITYNGPPQPGSPAYDAMESFRP